MLYTLGQRFSTQITLTSDFLPQSVIFGSWNKSSPNLYYIKSSFTFLLPIKKVFNILYRHIFKISTFLSNIFILGVNAKTFSWNSSILKNIIPMHCFLSQLESCTHPAAQFPLGTPPLLAHSEAVKQVPFRTKLEINKRTVYTRV
jgi:hypothetical protein